MSVVRFVYRNLDRFRWQFCIAIISGMLYGLAAFLIPISLAMFADDELSAKHLRNIILVLGGVYLAEVCFAWIVRRRGEAVAHKFPYHIRLKYYGRIEQLPVERLTNQHSGYLLSLVNKVADGLQPLLYFVLWSLTTGFVTLSLFFYFTARESVLIASANLFLLLSLVTLSMFLSRPMARLAGELNLRRASLQESYADLMSNVLTVKKLGAHSFAQRRLDEGTNSNYEQIEQVQRFHSRRWFLQHLVYGIVFIGTLSYLLWGVSQGDVSATSLILFVSAYAIIRSMIGQFSESMNALLEMRTYLQTLDSVVGQPEDVSGSTKETWNELSLINVVKSHPGTTHPIRIPDFRLTPGEQVCVTGGSGQGKSTLLNVLADYIKPDSGQRLVDDVPYEKVSADFFSSHIALISQEVDLFNVSLRRNLTLDENVAEERIWELLEALDLRKWVHSLDQGLETKVGEKGVRLSAGQKQRVNIARGLLLDRDICLLDEPTAHLDIENEARVVALLRRELANKSAVIVTHRSALVSLCDRRYHMVDCQLTKVEQRSTETTPATLFHLPEQTLRSTVVVTGE